LNDNKVKLMIFILFKSINDKKLELHTISWTTSRHHLQF